MEALTVPAVLESLSTIGQYVLEAADEAGLGRRAAYRLRLAVDEIATNIIDHGYGESGMTGDILVRADVMEDSLVVLLEDTATPFDPRSEDKPAGLDLPLEQRPDGGLGVFLATKGVDEFRYEHVGNLNRNILVMWRPAGHGIEE